jgi:hypothetical protein
MLVAESQLRSISSKRSDYSTVPPFIRKYIHGIFVLLNDVSGFLLLLLGAGSKFAGTGLFLSPTHRPLQQHENKNVVAVSLSGYKHLTASIKPINSRDVDGKTAIVGSGQFQKIRIHGLVARSGGPAGTGQKRDITGGRAGRRRR